MNLLQKGKGRGNTFAAVPSLVIHQSSIRRRSRSRIFLGPAYEKGRKADSAEASQKKERQKERGARAALLLDQSRKRGVRKNLLMLKEKRVSSF